MGREIRRIPKNWEHPKDAKGKYEPLSDMPQWNSEEATCYQIYENVSEGTPVSPVFETTSAMEDWIVANWKITNEAAKKFIELGYAPTFVWKPGTRPIVGYKALDDQEKEKCFKDKPKN